MRFCLSLIFILLLSLSLSFQAAARSRVEMVFVLDTTGSMSGLIEGAKKKIWAIANAVVDQNPQAEIYMGLVGYRDLGDDYVTRHFPLTTDIQSIYARLLTFEAKGGGDTPESVNEALDVALGRMGWSDGKESADRILFLVGDAPPHMDYEQDRKYTEIIREAAARSIIVNTVLCGNLRETARVWKEMAHLGKGEYMAIPQDGGTVVVVVTPYDDSITIIQKKLNRTILPYGAAALKRVVEEKARQYEEAPAPRAADISSYVNKSTAGKGVITGEGDLVADIKEGRARLDKIKEEELPEALRALPPAQREAHVRGLDEERARLSEELAAQVRLRDEYISGQSSAAPDSFDANVVKTLKKQIKAE
ncbi:MAG: VWA domain-containing protein [Deltaproteobacteria bacterium]|jgi:Mg-chelatase subunit ChlD|nr:VWA domain-containing protein [Deltaproteobacteria bacterium]